MKARAEAACQAKDYCKRKVEKALESRRLYSLKSKGSGVWFFLAGLRDKVRNHSIEWRLH